MRDIGCAFIGALVALIVVTPSLVSHDREMRHAHEEIAVLKTELDNAEGSVAFLCGIADPDDMLDLQECM